MTPGGWRLAGAAGLIVGVVYAFSPLTVWFAIAMVLLVRSAAKGIDGDEHRWILTLLVVAIALRVIAVAALFATTDHAVVPFRSFFGDDEYFIKRSIWLRNVALRIPIHGADLIYAFDEYSATSYLYVLAFVEVLVGPAPYGVHLLGIAFYLSASVLLYRTIRSSLGRMPALIGLVGLLFLPSLFAWSISALKDPLFFFLTAASLVLTVKLVRGPGWGARVLALSAIGALVVALETVRMAGGILTLSSVAAGLIVAWLVSHPRWMIAAIVAAPIAIGATLSRPSLQYKVYTAMQAAAGQHWGHVATPGRVYELLDQRFYPHKSEIADMRFDEAARFVVRSLVRYVTVPLPWEAQSAAALAYMPEQIIWYLLVALLPFGVVCSLRRDPVVASMLFAYAAVAALTVALVSGNVGTLVRHRGLALPYFVWLSALAACELLSRARVAADRPLLPFDPQPVL